MSEPYKSGAYADDNPDWHAEDAPFKAAALADLIRFAGLSPHTVADVGCGTGDVLRTLAAELDDELPDTVWEGWDIAGNAIRRARKKEGGKTLFVCADFLESERVVDLLLCIDVVEHVADDRAFLEALRDRADWFVFRIPLDLSALALVRPGRLSEVRRRYHHRHLYTREIALELLDATGYRIEQVVYDRVPPPRVTPRQRVVDRVRRGLHRVWPDATARWLGGFSLLVLCRARYSSS